MDKRGSVNWQDGMLIEASHFVEEMEFLRSLHDRMARLKLGGHGVYADTDGAPPLDLAVEPAGDRFRLVLRRFRGFFPCGLWVSYEADGDQAVQAEAVANPGGDETLAIHLLVREDDYLAFGPPDALADPPRRPWRQPRLQLALGTDPGWPRERCMLLGAIRVRSGIADFDPASIPASATMSSWPALRELASQLTTRLEHWRAKAIAKAIEPREEAQGAQGGMGRTLQVAQQETARLWALEVARLQALQPLHVIATPGQWFTSVRSLARGLLTMLDINRELARGAAGRAGFDDGVEALRAVADFVPDPDDLPAMQRRVHQSMEGVDQVLDAVFGVGPVDEGQLVYAQRTYHFVAHVSRAYRAEGQMEKLAIEGLAGGAVDDLVVVLRGTVARILRDKRPTIKLGANIRDSWADSDPTHQDLDFEERAVLVHPLNFRREKALNRLTLVCSEGRGLAEFERAGAQDVRVYVLQRPA